MSGPTQGDHTPDEFDDLVRDVAQETETADVQHPSTFRHPTIDGYEFLRELHRGAQGIVYETLQRSTKRKVAIKVLVAGRYASRTARRRFDREIELVAQLRHPNIISVFHSGETSDGMQYLVMDYVRGRPIDRYVREKTLSLPATMKLFTAVCDGVQFAHQRGVIHRDLKPSNVLVDTEGSPRVLDFGLAKVLANPAESLVSLSEQVVGTLNYMSPEQARGNPDEIDTRTDVYSLGVMLYRMLTGQFPYPVAGPISEAMRHIAETEPATLLRKWTPQLGVSARSLRRRGADDCPIDTDVQTIVLTALAKERERRYQTAGELARDIRHWLTGKPIDARRDNRWYVFRKTVKRNKAPVAAGCAFVALLCVAVVAVSVFWYRSEEARDVAEKQTTLAVELGQLAQDRLAQTRRHAYASDMLLAQQAWENADIKRVRSLLADHRPERGLEDLRGFEWYYYSRLCNTQIATGVMEHDVRALDYSPDGKMLAIGSYKTLIIRDLAGGREIELHGHENYVHSVSFSPDGKWLATGSEDGTLRLWDVDRAAERASADAGIPYSIDFAPAGNVLAVAGMRTDGTALAELWSVPDLEPRGTLSGHDGIVRRVVFFADGDQVLTGGDEGTVRIWSIATDKVIREVPANSRRLLAIALSPNEKLLATAGYDAGRDCQIKLGNLETAGSMTTLAESESQIWSLDFSPDGRSQLSGGSDRKAKLWDVERRTLRKVFRGHEYGITTVTFSPSGQTFATGGQDKTFRLWDVNLLQEAMQLPADEEKVTCLIVSPDGEMLASGGSDRTVRLWRDLTAPEPEELAGHAYPVTEAVFTPGCSTLITASMHLPWAWRGGESEDPLREAAGELKWWDVRRGVELAGEDYDGDYIVDLAISSDGATLATVRRRPANARRVDVWNVQSRAIVSSLTSNSLGSGVFTCLAYSPDGAWLAAGRDDGIASLWNLSESTEFPLAGHVGPVVALAFDPEGNRLAVISADGTLAIWNMTTRTAEFAPQEMGGLQTLCFSPDGKTLATAGRDSLISLWDVHTLQLRASFNVGPKVEGHDGVSALTFMPDGQRLVAAVGGDILVWVAATIDATD